MIRIVCEGDKTEPLFFTDLCDIYCFGDSSIDVRTIPQPPIVEEEVSRESSVRGFYRGKKRKTRNSDEQTIEPEKVQITGAPPLKWVKYARRILSEGVDESWAVYDKDEHPMHKEAFEEASREVNGKKVNIAFSSRSFEYYLLLHFEYIYHSFNATECGDRVNGKKIIYKCGTETHPEHDCHGERCINGYARIHGYWQETKSSISTFPLVKDRLINGIINACRLRAESDLATDAPFYERNPYTNVDKLVGRLIGCEAIEYGETFNYNSHGSNWIAKIDDTLQITNLGKSAELFAAQTITVYDYKSGKSSTLLDKNIMIEPQDTASIKCHLNRNSVICIKTPDKKIFLLGNQS